MIKAEDLPEGEEVYLKKDFLGEWRVVYPVEINGKFNWRRFIFGSKWNTIFLIFVIILTVLFYFGMSEALENAYLTGQHNCTTNIFNIVP